MPPVRAIGRWMWPAVALALIAIQVPASDLVDAFGQLRVAAELIGSAARRLEEVTANSEDFVSADSGTQRIEPGQTGSDRAVQTGDGLGKNEAVPPKLISRRAAANFTGKSLGTIKRWGKTGVIKEYRFAEKTWPMYDRHELAQAAGLPESECEP